MFDRVFGTRKTCPVLDEEVPMQFVIIARDGTGPDAIAKRKAIRPAHLEAIRPLIEAGNVPLGGAMLNEDGEMVGSVMIVDLPAREDVDEWLAAECYVTSGVWNEVEVHPFRAAVGSWVPDS
jgi:uncharacterized protein YciI